MGNKWHIGFFKHSNDATFGVSIQALIKAKQYRAIALFYFILERLSAQNDGCDLVISCRLVASTLGTDRRGVANDLGHLVLNFSGTSAELVADLCRISVPNFLELQKSKNQKTIYKKRIEENRGECVDKVGEEKQKKGGSVRKKPPKEHEFWDLFSGAYFAARKIKPSASKNALKVAAELEEVLPREEWRFAVDSFLGDSNPFYHKQGFQIVWLLRNLDKHRNHSPRVDPLADLFERALAGDLK